MNRLSRLRSVLAAIVAVLAAIEAMANVHRYQPRHAA